MLADYYAGIDFSDVVRCVNEFRGNKQTADAKKQMR